MHEHRIEGMGKAGQLSPDHTYVHKLICFVLFFFNDLICFSLGEILSFSVFHIEDVQVKEFKFLPCFRLYFLLFYSFPFSFSPIQKKTQEFTDSKESDAAV